MITRALGWAIVLFAALPACSKANGGTNNSSVQTPARPGQALIGMWSGESGARCWAEVIEFRADEMTYRVGGGGSDLKSAKISFKDAGPNRIQVVPEAGAPVTYTVNDASHVTDGAGCLFQRTD